MYISARWNHQLELDTSDFTISRLFEIKFREDVQVTLPIFDNIDIEVKFGATTEVFEATNNASCRGVPVMKTKRDLAR